MMKTRRPSTSSAAKRTSEPNRPISIAIRVTIGMVVVLLLLTPSSAEGGNLHRQERSWVSAPAGVKPATTPAPAPGDADGDGVYEVGVPVPDNCPYIVNTDQADSDADGFGDVCDREPSTYNPDPDRDRVWSAYDNCPTVYNPDINDNDGDGVGDRCDNSPMSQYGNVLNVIVRDQYGNPVPGYINFHLDFVRHFPPPPGEPQDEPYTWSVDARYNGWGNPGIGTEYGGPVIDMRGSGPGVRTYVNVRLTSYGNGRMWYPAPACSYARGSASLGSSSLAELNFTVHCAGGVTQPPVCPSPEATYRPIVGDDLFTWDFNGATCDINTELEIPRFYGLTDAQGHIAPPYLGTSAAYLATLEIDASNVNEDVEVSFGGQRFYLDKRAAAYTTARQINTQALVLPKVKGYFGNAPVPGLNQLTIRQSASPGPQRALIHQVRLKLKGMRPLVLAAGFGLSFTDPANSDWNTEGYFDLDLWHNNPPYDQFSFAPDRYGRDSIGPGFLPDGSHTIGGGATLGVQIEKLKAEYGVQKVNILGHSMGGLWGREYALVVDREQSVDKLIMLGTPNSGSFWADGLWLRYLSCRYQGDLACQGYLEAYERLSPAVQQLTGSYLNEYNRTHGPASGVHYYDLAGERGVWGVSLWSNDEAVSTDSVQALRYSTHLPPVLIDPWGTVHQAEPKHASFQAALENIYRWQGNCYAYAACAADEVLNGHQEAKPSSSRGAVDDVGNTTPGQSTTSWPGTVSTIMAGQPQTLDVVIDSSSRVTFALGWLNYPTSTLELTLRDPSGRVITPTNSYSGSVYMPAVDGVSYAVANPIPGVWQAIVEAQNVPSDGETYYLAGEFEGGVEINPALSASTTRVGQPVTVTATLRDNAPIAGAVVTASITLLSNPSAIPVTMALAEEPTGIYRGAFTPGEGGTYAVTLFATGHNNSNESFKRQSVVQLQAGSGAELGGAYVEQAYGWTGDQTSPPYDSLMITTTATITEAGLYRISGRLTDGSGVELARYTSEIQYLTAQGVELSLHFDGRDIGSAAVDGPYQLRDVRLTRLLDGELVVAEVPLAFVTRAYSRHDWLRDDVLQTGVAVDQGVDTNGNGLYDYLRVSVPLDVLHAGTYNATADLLTADGSRIGTATVLDRSFVQGTNSLTLDFSGKEIHASGVNGPYRVERLTFHNLGPSAAHLPVVLAGTAPYSSTNFEGSVEPSSTAPATPSATATASPTSTSILIPTGTTAATNTYAPATATRTAIQTRPTETPAPLTNTATSVAVTVATLTPCPITFTDVPPQGTFYVWIKCLACKSIISGYADGTFRPNNLLSRGQLSKIVSQAAGFNEPVMQQTYIDVEPGSPFYNYIGRLSSRNVISGYACGRVAEECDAENRPYFRPNSPASRGQLSKIVSNTAYFTEDPGAQIFSDVAPSSPFYDYINRLANRQVISGYRCGGAGETCDAQNRAYFRPNYNVTRGQASKIVANTFFPNCRGEA